MQKKNKNRFPEHTNMKPILRFNFMTRIHIKNINQLKQPKIEEKAEADEGKR